MNRQLLANINTMVLAQGAFYLLPLILIPFLVTNLGVATYGLFALAQAVISVGLAVVHCGFDLFVTRDIAQHREDPVRVRRLVSNTLLLQFLTGVALVAAVYALGALFEHSELLHLLGIFSLALIGQALFPIWYFQGCENFRQLAFIQLLMRFNSFVLILVLVDGPEDAALVAGIYAFSYLATGVHGVRVLWQQGLLERPRLSHSLRLTRQAGDPFVSGLITVVLNNLPIFFLGMLASREEVGGFSAIYRVFFALKSLATTCLHVLLPNLVSASETPSPVRVTTRVLLLLLAALTVMFLLSEWMLTLLYNDRTLVSEYLSVYWILLVSLVPGILAALFILVFAALHKNYSGRRRVLVAGLLFSLAVYPFSAAVYGAHGMALAVFLCECLIMVLGIRMVGKNHWSA